MTSSIRRIAQAAGIALLTGVVTGCVPLTVAAFEWHAIESVRRELVNADRVDLEAMPNRWGEGLFVVVAAGRGDVAEWPVWLYLGDGTYRLGPESARLTPHLPALSDAPPITRDRAQLDRVSIAEIRAYVTRQR